MGTRSNIAYEQPNGEVIITYWHWDRYPTYNGQVLNDHYNNPKKAEEIANQGYISSLKPTVQESIEDRANHDAPIKYNSLNAYLNDIAWDIEYAYIYSNNQWYCNERNLININPQNEIDKNKKVKATFFEPLWSVLVKYKKESA